MVSFPSFVNWTTGLPEALGNYISGTTVTVNSASITADTSLPSAIYLCGDYSDASDRTIDFGAVSTYNTNYHAFLYNNGTRRYTININGGQSFYLWPKQAAILYSINGSTWGQDYSPIFVVPGPLGISSTTALTIYVNHDTGSSAYDGLSVNSPLNSIASAVAYIDKYIDAFQQGVQIQVLSTDFQEHNISITKRLRGYHVLSIVGNNAAPQNCVWNIGYGQTALTTRDWSGAIVSGFTVQAAQAIISSVDTATDTFTTSTTHRFSVGNAVQFKATGGLPAPLAANTDYYIISANFSTTTFSVSTTPGGAAVNLTTTGAGTIKAGVSHCTFVSSSQHGICDVGAGTPGVTSMRWGWLPGFGRHMVSTNGGSIGYVTNSKHELIEDFYAHWYVDPTSAFICTGCEITAATAYTNNGAFLVMTGGSMITAGVTFSGAGIAGWAGAKYSLAGNGIWISNSVVLPGVGFGVSGYGIVI